MVPLRKLEPLTPEFLESIGFFWHTDSDETSYIADEAVVIDEVEAEAYYEAANTLYAMFVEAGEYVIENDLFHEIGIPFNLVDAVKKSWENDVHWHIYGRFDLAGGVGGDPIKLLEFNADTPTALFETAIVQWALLKANGYAPEVIEYLKTPPNTRTIRELVEKLGMKSHELLRKGESEYQSLGLQDPTDEQVVDAIVKHPILLQRPIVVAGDRAAIGRPPEAVLDMLS